MDTSINELEMTKLLSGRYGSKKLAKYYLNKASDAAARAKVALANQNPYSLGAEAQIMIANIEMLKKVFAEEETPGQTPESPSHT